MKKHIALALIVIAVVVALSSCSTFNKTTNGQLGYGKISGKDMGTFEAKGPVTYILHPSIVALNNTADKLDTIIDPALAEKGANAATNLVIENGYDIVGFAVRYVTGGLIGLDFVKVTGTAIKQ